MIQRHITEHLNQLLKQYPTIAISGPRQVGKSTLAYQFVREGNFNYVSLDNIDNRFEAIKNPIEFLNKQKLPLIIDEIQYATNLLDVIVSIINQKRLIGENANGLFIITGSQAYEFLEKVTETMAGRVAIIKLNPLSQNEIDGFDRGPFVIDLDLYKKKHKTLDELSLFSRIIKGYYPELHNNPTLDAHIYFKNYVATYINRDVTQILNVQDLISFEKFMTLLASFTGQELVINNIAKTIGKNSNTIKSWLSVLKTSGIIYLLPSYNEKSVNKRIVKRDKIYFTDTGLAAYLLSMSNPSVLLSSNYAGSFFETYVVNEIRKTYENYGIEFNAFYYRDNNQNEIDLIIIHNSYLYRLEIKKGKKYKVDSIKAFSQLKSTQFKITYGGIICSIDTIHKLDDQNFLVPFTYI